MARKKTDTMQSQRGLESRDHRFPTTAQGGHTVKIEIEISEDDFALIEQFTEENRATEGNSHGPLDLIVLAEMLMQDVALAVRRPGSWEGSNMAEVLRCHGYSV